MNTHTHTGLPLFDKLVQSNKQQRRQQQQLQAQLGCSSNISRSSSGPCDSAAATEAAAAEPNTTTTTASTVAGAAVNGTSTSSGISGAVSGGGGSGAGDSSGSGNEQQHIAQPAVAHTFAEMDQAFDRQAQCASRMQLLLNKEYVLHIAAAAWFVGNLSWEQYARASVLVWPYPLRLALLAKAIVEYYQQQHGAAAA